MLEVHADLTQTWFSIMGSWDFSCWFNGLPLHGAVDGFGSYSLCSCTPSSLDAERLRPHCSLSSTDSGSSWVVSPCPSFPGNCFGFPGFRRFSSCRCPLRTLSWRGRAPLRGARLCAAALAQRRARHFAFGLVPIFWRVEPALKKRTLAEFLGAMVGRRKPCLGEASRVNLC